MAENFVEKELGVSLDKDESLEAAVEKKASVPAYTPPKKENSDFLPGDQRESSLAGEREIPKGEGFIGASQTIMPPQPQVIQQPVIQIIEKVVYKKQRIHGFFRTLTIIALLAIGFLMLGESTGIVTLSINSFKLHQIFPIVIILSSIIIRSYRGIFGKIFGLIIFMAVRGGLFTISVYTSLNPSNKRKSGNVINYDLGGIDNLSIGTLVGNSYIEGSGQDISAQGTRKSDRNLWASTGDATLKLDEDNNRNVLEHSTSNIDLTLPTDKMIDMLYIKNLLGLHTIDLNNLQWKTLKFNAGIDDITIKIGNVISGNKIEIEGTAADIELDIPEDIGVMMYYKHFIGMFKAPKFETLTGHYFQSTNMATSKATLNIYINLGVGNTKINRIGAK